MGVAEIFSKSGVLVSDGGIWTRSVPNLANKSEPEKQFLSSSCLRKQIFLEQIIISFAIHRNMSFLKNISCFVRKHVPLEEDYS